jgi:hypothetical protein
VFVARVSGFAASNLYRLLCDTSTKVLHVVTVAVVNVVSEIVGGVIVDFGGMACDVL